MSSTPPDDDVDNGDGDIHDDGGDDDFDVINDCANMMGIWPAPKT